MKNAKFTEMKKRAVSHVKGAYGEWSTRFGLYLTLDRNAYLSYHNLILSTGGGSSQIDLVLHSSYGLFVIEVKHYQGEIYGNANGQHWSQLSHGRSFSFLNPIRQNNGHAIALAGALKIPSEKIRPIVFFSGDAELKSAVPPNVLTSGLPAYIESFQEKAFDVIEFYRIKEELDRLKKIQISNPEHIRNARKRMNPNE